MKKQTIGAEHYYGVVCEKFMEAKQAGCSEMLVSRSGMVREVAYLTGKDTGVIIIPQRDSVFVEYSRTPQYKVNVGDGVKYSSSPLRVSAEPNRVKIALKDSLQPANQVAVLGLFQATRSLRPDTQKMDRGTHNTLKDDKSIDILEIKKKTSELITSLIRISGEYGEEFFESFEDGVNHTAASTGNVRMDFLSEPASLELLGECSMMLTVPENEPYELDTDDMKLVSDEFHILVENDELTVLVDPLVNENELSLVTAGAKNRLKMLLMEAIPAPINNGY